MTQFTPPTLKPNDYTDYFHRFIEVVGEIEEGQYGQYKGRLVLKMNRAQFEERYQQYLNLGIHYGELLERSDTIEDSITVDLRAAEIELLIKSSLFLPFPKYLG
jgi:hypothetical protein